MQQRRTIRVSSRNQILIPLRVREQLHIKSGDRLLVEVCGNVITCTLQKDGDASPAMESAIKRLDADDSY